MPRPRPIPFLAHQLLEYLVAAALAGLSIHVRHSALLLIAAGALALLAVTSRGPLGLARVCGPRLHGALDIVVALAVAAAPLLPALRPDVTGIAVVEVTAVAWLRLATLTRYRRAGNGPVAPVSGPVTGPEAGPAGGALPAAPVASAPTTVPVPPRGAVVLRALGMVAARSTRRIPEAEAKLHSGARQAGRHAARVQRAWSSPPDAPGTPSAPPGSDGEAPGT